MNKSAYFRAWLDREISQLARDHAFTRAGSLYRRSGAEVAQLLAFPSDRPLDEADRRRMESGLADLVHRSPGIGYVAPPNLRASLEIEGGSRVVFTLDAALLEPSHLRPILTAALGEIAAAVRGLVRAEIEL